MIAAVGNRYNLGAEKLKNWLKADNSRWARYNGTVFISAIFTWDFAGGINNSRYWRRA